MSISENRSTDKAKTIFLGALEIEADAERRAFIDAQCGDNQSLREEVERLLAHQGDVGSFLESPPPGVDVGVSPTVDHSPPETIGGQIGPYKLLQQLGEGGMGVVYLAERQQPVKQRVALKIIKHGMDSKQFIARFEAERQALAMMDHPNIAKVLDAGCTEHGRPYFVMELVKGVPISQFCDDNRLTTRERLELFVQVCQAVHHAHQKGIIHRDLKPSNVLVALYDDKPVPKVIDFGVAKATNQQLTEKTLFTEVGSILGTWEYMSPEQAVLNQLDVDTRTDVYSLGVLLYELLTGETPLDRQRLREAQIMETLRMIREDEPPKPSTRVSSLGQHASTMAAYRKTKPDALASEIRGDLDWIVMKALAKERSRRYDSANRFAEDVQRYLNNDVVEARPPSTWYQFQKFYQRNKTLAKALSVAVLALALGLSAAVWGLVQVAAKNRELEGQRDEQRALSETLREKNDELANALRDWRHVLLERGIEAALRGDVSAARDVAEKARQAVAPEAWVLLIEGLALQHAGDTALARGKLTSAYRLAPESLGIASAFTMAAIGDRGVFVNANDEGLAADLLGNLDKLTPSIEFRKYDLLFRGWSQVYEDPKEAIKTIHQVVDERYPWPFAQAMLAMCQVHVASDTGNPETALLALQTIRKCEGQLPDSAFVMFVGIHCRLWACLLAKEQIDLPTVVSETEELAIALRQRPNGWAADSRAAYFELVEHPNTYQEYQTVRNDWWLALRAAVMLRSDLAWPRENVSFVPEDSPFRAVGEACALTLAGDNRGARRLYEKLSTLPSPIIRTVALEILLCLEDLQQVQVTSNELLDELNNERGLFDPPFWFLKERVRATWPVNRSRRNSSETSTTPSGANVLPTT